MKCQNQVAWYEFHHQTRMVGNVAETYGLKVLREMHLIGPGRVGKQTTPRNNYSPLVIIGDPEKKRKK